MEQLVWADLENDDCTRHKLHCYKPATRGPEWNRYEGNRALCRNSGAHDGEKYLSVDKIESSPLDRSTACKTCLRIYDKIKGTVN